MLARSLKLEADLSAACPICGQGAGAPAWTAQDGSRGAYACEACDFTYIWPRLPQDFSNEPAESYYDDWKMVDYSAGHFYVTDIGNSEGHPSRGQRDPAEPRSILDVGCGAGQMLMEFRFNGWDVRGVDPWASVTAIGRKYLRLPIETARIEEATSVPPGSQDVVLSIDVFQFVADPLAFLKACMAALKPGGLLYLTLPNYASADSRQTGWAHNRFVPGSYLSYFTPASAMRILKKAGFSGVRVKTFGAGEDSDDFLKVTGRRPIENRLSWADLSSDVDDRDLPPLDRSQVNISKLSPEQRSWREQGYVILPGLIPDDVVARYCAIRGQVSHRQGWTSSTPYMTVPEIRDLCLYKPLTDMIEHLIGEPVGLHLNLTGWVSTERDWHQDDYLNPPRVNGHYAGVWTALDQIQPDAGPFEFVPGSHRWPIIRQAKVLELLGYANGDDPSWPWASERLLTPFFEKEIAAAGLKVERFLGKKGDVLIWHPRLVHRGSLPDRHDAERRSMISHYSAISRRSDMPNVRRHPGGGQYFVLNVKADEAAAAPVQKRFRWL
jgi:2-polyprenyl-3-methyl-5-hydroxy-6-metoxy-1,4-benzoquinol methylase